MVTPDDLVQLIVSQSALVAFIIHATGFLNRVVKFDGWWARALSWVVSVLAVFVACHLSRDMGVGYMADFTPLRCAFEIPLVALAANGVFTIDEVKAYLTRIGATKPAE